MEFEPILGKDAIREIIGRVAAQHQVVDGEEHQAGAEQRERGRVAGEGVGRGVAGGRARALHAQQVAQFAQEELVVGPLGRAGGGPAGDESVGVGCLGHGVRGL